jgi:hypothetical protein
MVVELLKIEVGSKYRCESGRSSDPADHREIPYSAGLSLRVSSCLAEYGAIENLDFVWEERNFGYALGGVMH